MKRTDYLTPMCAVLTDACSDIVRTSSLHDEAEGLGDVEKCFYW